MKWSCCLNRSFHLFLGCFSLNLVFHLVCLFLLFLTSSPCPRIQQRYINRDSFCSLAPFTLNQMNNSATLISRSSRRVIPILRSSPASSAEPRGSGASDPVCRYFSPGHVSSTTEPQTNWGFWAAGEEGKGITQQVSGCISWIISAGMSSSTSSQSVQYL